LNQFVIFFICFDEDFDENVLPSAKKSDNFFNVNILYHFRPYETTTFCESKGKTKLQAHLSWNFDFVFTNFFQNENEAVQ
jgi:hypothetical protein